MKNYVVIRSKL